MAHQFSVRYQDRELLQNIQEDIDINGDPLLLKLLVSNLLENANKYSPKDKAITIELNKNIRLIQLSVQDEGCGISEDRKEKCIQKILPHRK